MIKFIIGLIIGVYLGGAVMCLVAIRRGGQDEQ